MDELVYKNEEEKARLKAIYHLVKEDRNGTLRLVDVKCCKCGGRGYIDYYCYIEQGVCFRCGGNGFDPHPTVIKAYSKSYFDALMARRQKMNKAKWPETLANFGVGPDMVVRAVLGNSYAVKDTLKEMGAKYKDALGWHFLASPQEQMPDGTELFEVELSEEDLVLCDDGRISYIKEEVYDKVRKARDDFKEAHRPASPSQWLGEIGQKVELKATFINYNGFDTAFGVSFLYTFVDENENVLTWFSSTYLPDTVEKGQKVTLRGTVKEHKEYKGTKQTALTRCKVTPV